MNPKVIGIFILVVGLGIGLYFIQSGGAGKVGSILQTPGGVSTTLSAVSTSSSAVAGGNSGVSGATSTANGFSWRSFFQSLFAVHGFGNIPTVGSGNGSSGGNAGAANGEGPGGAASSNLNLQNVTPPPGFTVTQLSPYYHEVRLSGVSQGEITLSTYPGYGAIATTTIDVTGWEIKTNRGGEFVPGAENLYYPVGVNPPTDIILTLAPNPTQYVNMYSNTAPVNLRVNECLGYLNATRQFNPGFAYDCPVPDRSQLSQFTGACQNYVASLYNCQSPDFSSSYFPRNDYQCEDYLAGKYNYNWCVSTYASSPNFFSNEWRVWMGATPLDPYHDIVELLDRNGLLVDYYSY